VGARGRTPGGTRTRTEEDLLDTEGELPPQDDDTDTSFTSLEQHLFGSRHFEHQGEMYEGEQTTMLQPPGEQETVMQHDVNQPPPTQVVMELPPGARPIVPVPVTSTPVTLTRPSHQGNLIAAGGVFAGMSFVMAGSLVALGIAAAVLIAFVLSPPGLWAPPSGTPVPPTMPPLEVLAPISDIPPELALGVRFPAMFAFNDWRAQDLDEPAIEALMVQLAGCRAVQLTGHTDPRGNDEINDRIALARASEVRRILVERGIERSHIEVASAGSGAPEIEDLSPEARALNRRVTVRCN
jgi:flagellar motor protein MotB